MSDVQRHLQRKTAESAGKLELLVRRLVERIAGTLDKALVAEVLEALEGGLPRGRAESAGNTELPVY